MYKVVITDYLTPPASIEQEQLVGVADVSCLEARSNDELIGTLGDADGLIVFHEVSVPKEVIDTLDRCRVHLCLPTVSSG